MLCRYQLEDSAAADYADDHIGNEHRSRKGKDGRADAGTFPSVAEELNLGLMTELLAERPEPRSDEKDG